MDKGKKRISMILVSLLVLTFLLALFDFSIVSSLVMQKNVFETSSSSLSSSSAGIGMKNPAAVYCSDVMGYDYKKIKTDSGEKGICVMLNGNECEEWSFLNGRCGTEFSYCEKNGMKSKIVSDGKNALSKEHVVCLSRDKRAKRVGSVSELTRLLERSRVGSGVLDIAEETRKEKGSMSSLASVADLPVSFDWRNKDEKDFMTPVKNQGTCGACWAFSAVGTVEGQYNVAKNNADFDLDLSEQYLISDCFGDGNCVGGDRIIALNFFTSDGVPDEACYAFVDRDSVCSERCVDWSERVWKIYSHEQVPKNRDEIKDWLVNKGPISNALNTKNLYWDKDIMRCNPDLLQAPDHAWIITGYNDTGQYWIVKNSWGLGWGENGYGKIGYDECYIEKRVEGVNICECGEWKNDKCGVGACNINEMRQTRICNIASCDVSERCVENTEVCTEKGFVRGKVNNDDSIDIGDAVFILDYLFKAGDVPECLDAADVNDDGAIDIGDAVYLLAYLFAEGPEPAEPFEVAGVDPTPDDLFC